MEYSITDIRQYVANYDFTMDNLISDLRELHAKMSKDNGDNNKLSAFPFQSLLAQAIAREKMAKNAYADKCNAETISTPNYYYQEAVPSDIPTYLHPIQLPSFSSITVPVKQELPSSSSLHEKEAICLEDSSMDSESNRRSREKFLKIMGRLDQNRERTRQILGRQRYKEYVDRLKMPNKPGPRRNYKETRIASRFQLDPSGEILLDRNSGKPYICYEEMYDCIHRSYQKPKKYGGLRAVYAELKETYANITLQSVTMYLRARGDGSTDEQSDGPKMTNSLI